jgi:molecular chaperone GrpE
MRNKDRASQTGPTGSDDAYERGAGASASVGGEEDVDQAAPTEQAPATEQGDGSSAPDMDSDVAELSGRTDWKRQVDEHRDKYLRLAAEYDNFRKRAVRERQEAGWRAQGEMVRGLIESLDDLTRFAHVDPVTVDAATVVQGVDMVERKIMKSLAGHGLEIVDPVDHPFDPKVHEAVATEPALSAEDDHLVSKVYQRGYLFNGQLLRPARVVVKQWNG